MEQERLLEEPQENSGPMMMADQPMEETSQNKVVIPEKEIVHFPVNTKKGG